MKMSLLLLLSTFALSAQAVTPTTCVGISPRNNSYILRFTSEGDQLIPHYSDALYINERYTLAKTGVENGNFVFSSMDGYLNSDTRQFQITFQIDQKGSETKAQYWSEGLVKFELTCTSSER